MPEEHESATIENIDSATSENIGGDAAPPVRDAVEERKQWVARGIAEGTKRALQKLGLSGTLDEAAEQLTTPKEPLAVEAEAGVPATPIADTKEFRELAVQYRAASKETRELQTQLVTLQAQADQARLDKLRSAALSMGVGPGQQVEAFIRLYQDRVRFDAEQGLEVLSRMPDGTMVAAGETIEELLKKVVEENKFLLAVSGGAPVGAGSRLAPTQEQQDNSFGMLGSLGVKKG